MPLSIKNDPKAGVNTLEGQEYAKLSRDIIREYES